MAFAKKRDADLATFAGGVHDGHAQNPVLFANPPVALTVLSGAIAAFGLATAAADQGSVAQTNDKKVKRRELISILRQLAVFVEATANGDAQIIRASGFEVTYRGHSPQRQLVKPEIRRILNEMSTQLVVGATRVPTARSYEVEIRVGDGPWQRAGLFLQARRMVLKELTPGTVYEIRVRAIGGSTGYSDWSDPVQHMCM